MALTISQMVAASYNDVLNEKRTPTNQWAESPLMRYLEKLGAIERRDLGPQIEATLDYQRNPGTVIQSTELQPLSTSLTEVLTAAVFTPAEITAPITWSKKQEATNPTRTQKVALVKSLTSNAIDSHDDIIEQALFATSTNGFLGFGTHITTAGTGSDGGVDSGTFTFWRNQTSTYVDDTDIESAFTLVWNAASKGSGSQLMPKLVVSDSTTQALFEGSQQAQQRYNDTQDLKAGFKTLMFKTALYVFSQYGGTSAFFLNPESFKMVVSKQYFRDLSDTVEFSNANGYTRKIYSVGQTVVNNRSRLGVAHL